ncbi:hypothetical protein DFP72DRAFT_1072466 [Ephemerocybe angulata]|uniref:26S proteasome complex subunit SEM1 n=1 Tax=Ephemerocybe angulata TaxID=980116 RepID=A0A8H6HP51_9AGAR|nr:hypothetical protein DFP72DRAFT_1072466 [Tulosesus angulatus]
MTSPSSSRATLPGPPNPPIARRRRHTRQTLPIVRPVAIASSLARASLARCAEYAVVVVETLWQTPVVVVVVRVGREATTSDTYLHPPPPPLLASSGSCTASPTMPPAATTSITFARCVDAAQSLGVLEEDDEFVEFAADWDDHRWTWRTSAGRPGAAKSTGDKLWKYNWDDDDIKEDFSMQLRLVLVTLPFHVYYGCLWGTDTSFPSFCRSELAKTKGCDAMET